MKEKKLSLYQFTDVKIYLRQWRDQRRAADKGFTNQYICHELGQVNSRGYFNNVLSGRVRIGAALVERFVQFLALDRDEAAYFRALVNYSQAVDGVDQSRFFRELLSRNREPSRQMDRKALQYYGEWYHAVVRAALDICDCDGEDFTVLRERIVLSVTEKELRSSVALLQELALIALDENGFWKPTDIALSCGDDIQREVVRAYQASNLALSSRAILDQSIEPQKVTALTVSVSDEAFDQIKKRIDQLRAEVRTIVQQDDAAAEKLYQLNMHLFPQLR